MPYLPPSSAGEEPTVPEDLSPHQRPELASFRGEGEGHKVRRNGGREEEGGRWGGHKVRGERGRKGERGERRGGDEKPREGD